ncbi:hypothetical protein SUGI_0412970 [Cryptomeria japonica]|uniref:serine/threonine-protein kinase STY13-like n=1 Tax=Cryptomeria japonica TaxID=3369 RepID=UPI002408BBEF|nr:serine/threonine-protein kinase STY13-like [Cryptomeria japonica]GLJ22040.1 hypothetical protein SUGI_0412970 [Cryptomeria japonica]
MEKDSEMKTGQVFGNRVNIGESSQKKEGFFRADQIDLKNLDAQLEKHLRRAWTMEKKSKRAKEEWEIDLKKLLLKGKIAQGTFGTIYRGVFDGHDVAVKVLDWGDEESRRAAEMSAFLQEVGVWHKLDHPNITKFIGASMGSSSTYLMLCSNDTETTFRAPSNHSVSCVVLEYLVGGTLKNYLIKNRIKKLDFNVVIQLALDISRGLSYLHSQKIVHRDVKAENMLLDRSGSVKIANFCVARVEAENLRDMTGTTGTLGYMAPEVLDGKPYNRKCDVYSFGICLWEIYSCEMAYAHLSFSEFTAAVVTRNVRPKIPRSCPTSLATVIKKCWDENPEKRPEMDEVVELLEKIDTRKGKGMVPMSIDQFHGCFCNLFSHHGR